MYAILCNLSNIINLDRLDTTEKLSVRVLNSTPFSATLISKHGMSAVLYSCCLRAQMV